MISKSRRNDLLQSQIPKFKLELNFSQINIKIAQNLAKES